jgi:hypothetical protein
VLLGIYIQHLKKKVREVAKGRMWFIGSNISTNAEETKR